MGANSKSQYDGIRYKISLHLEYPTFRSLDVGHQNIKIWTQVVVNEHHSKWGTFFHSLPM